MDEHQREATAERIRALMAERGWSQASLAEAAGVAENTVGDMLAGKKNTQPGKLRAMLEALGVPEPQQGILVLDGVEEDVRLFATVVIQRLSVLDDTQRAVALAKLYPHVLALT